MSSCTSQNVRQFIIAHYAEKLADRNLSAEDAADSFDLLLEGIIDSLGILELIAAIEDKFEVEIDLESLDAEQLTVIGSLATHVEKTARPRAGKTT